MSFSAADVLNRPARTALNNQQSDRWMLLNTAYLFFYIFQTRYPTTEHLKLTRDSHPISIGPILLKTLENIRVTLYTQLLHDFK